MSETLLFRKLLRKLLTNVTIFLRELRGQNMTVSYNKLWKLLIDKKMSKAVLRRNIGISPNTMTKLNRDEEASLAVLGKICETLHADVGDIVEYVGKKEGVTSHD